MRMPFVSSGFCKKRAKKATRGKTLPTRRSGFHFFAERGGKRDVLLGE